MKAYGYLRVSTLEQSTQKFKNEILQYANDKNLGKVDFVEEKISGTKNWRDRELGKLLDITMNYERGHWQLIPNAQFDVKTLRTNYLSALRWAGDLSDSLLSKQAA